jgi:uridine kinase
MLAIGIAGGTGSGKTTIAKAIVERIGSESTSLVPQDSYYLDRSDLTLKQREQINYDHPDSFENELLLEHLERLRQGRSVQIPTYDFARHTRSEKTILIPAKPVIIIEGILILADPLLREALNIRVFVHTDPDIRILRRAIRDTSERGRTLQSIDHQYVSTVKPMHETFVEPSKKHAHIIIPEGGHNEVAISLLTTWIEHYLTKTMEAPKV